MIGWLARARQRSLHFQPAAFVTTHTNTHTHTYKSHPQAWAELGRQ